METDKLPGQVSVEADGYEKYDRNITLSSDNLTIESIHLKPMNTPAPISLITTTIVNDVMASNSLIFTPTPSPIPKFLESFENYDNDNALLNYFWVNNAEKANEASLHLVSSTHIGEGKKAIALYFNIRNPQPNLNYSGFERIFPPIDLSKYSLLCIWVENPNNQDFDLVVQLGEANQKGEPTKHIWKKEVWKFKTTLPAQYKKDLCMSLSKNFFFRTDWSALENDEIDLETIDYYGFFVEGTPGSGVIYIDNIGMVQLWAEIG